MALEGGGERRSAVDVQCYKAGNSCPENHHVCKPEYCEMDVWKAIIAGFKAASPGRVAVLGSVDASTTTSLYSDLDMDGFYKVGAASQARTLPDNPGSLVDRNVRKGFRLVSINFGPIQMA